MHHSRAFLALLVALGVFALLLVGCEKNETVVGNDQIVGSGRIVSQARNLGSVNGIQVTSFAKVIITQDTVESLRIEADDNIIGLVRSSVVGSDLVVGLPEGSYRNVTVRVYASMRNISRLESLGAADFSATNSIRTDSITCRIKGAGSITLAGTTNYERVEIIGAGDIHNFDLSSTTCTASISGAGSIELHATQRLDATIAGTGSITYAGNPPIVHQSVTGVGAIRPRP
ncbi:MAG: DUF2807 domain-containing protein [Ignavibacteriae bacterium]|nr:DUF2807 domain-containing protein [Ignavibacteriota bacterium]